MSQELYHIYQQLSQHGIPIKIFTHKHRHMQELDFMLLLLFKCHKSCHFYSGMQDFIFLFLFSLRVNKIKDKMNELRRSKSGKPVKE